MTQEQQKLFNRLVQSWVKASRLLRIQVSAPLSASHGGRVVEGVAFLPDFGSANGMVIGAAFRPGLITDDTLETFANRKQMFYASLSLPGYQDYSEEKYKEALNDWGYFGPIATCPNWFTGYNHTQIGMTHQELVRAWTEASHSLNIRVITDCEPFAARCTFVALLPDFGSPAGMVLGAMYPPGFDK